MRKDTFNQQPMVKEPVLFGDMIERKEATKKWLYLPFSFVLHVCSIAVLLIVPLLTAEIDLPTVKTVEVTMIVPPKAGGVPGLLRAKAGQADRHKQGPLKKPVSTQAAMKTLTAPIEIPNEITEEAFTADGNESGFPVGEPGEGVDGGFEWGDSNAIFGSNKAGSQDGNATPKRVTQAPRVLKKVHPVYPEIAKRAHIQGKVEIEAETDIWGKVIRAEVITGHCLLVGAALEAVRQWIYEPYIINGLPKPVRFAVTLDFLLKIN